MSLQLCPAPRNSVATERAEPSLEHRLLWCLREAVRRTFDKQGLAADAMGIDRGHFSNQLNGIEPFDFRRLGRVPETATEFAALLAKAAGHRLASHNTDAARRRRRAVALHCIELTRVVLEAEDDDEPGAFPFL